MSEYRNRTTLIAPGTEHPVEVETSDVEALLQRGFRFPAAAQQQEQTW